MDVGNQFLCNRTAREWWLQVDEKKNNGFAWIDKGVSVDEIGAAYTNLMAGISWLKIEWVKSGYRTY